MRVLRYLIFALLLGNSPAVALDWQASARAQEVTPVAVVAPDPEGYDSFAEFLLRHLFLWIESNDLTTVRVHRPPGDIESDLNIRRVLAEIRKISSWSSARITPFNIFVQYTDREKTTVSKVFLKQDIHGDHLAIDPQDSPEKVVIETAGIVSEVLASGRYLIQGTDFTKAQSDSSSVLMENEAGRSLRIFGVDGDFRDFLIDHLRKSLNSIGFEMQEGYFFGSRVMTRDRVLELDPTLEGNLPLTRGKLVKNKIRERGLTNISDLEMLLIIREIKPTSGNAQSKLVDEEMRIRQIVRTHLNAQTRRFPFGLKIMIDQGDQLPGFKLIQSRLGSQADWLLSPEQFVRFYLDCSSLLQSN